MSSDTATIAPETAAANGHGDAHSTAGFKALLLGSIGVVYGDIGTSPLYALREAVVAAGGPAATSADPGVVLGILSMILWALIVVVTLKYVLILLRADNNGEGGTLALMALAQRAVGNRTGAIVLLGIISGALFYGDAVITPALSVLSAIEGIKLVTATFDPYVVPLTVIILVLLFAVQSRGTARVAAWFGPVMCIWFTVIAIAAVPHVLRHPQVLLALNPLHAVSFMTHHGMIGFITLGAVFLAVTGAEALYADLGHFGKKPIQTAWLVIVLPSLALNYLGQGALLMADPKAIENPFFLMFPDWALIPMVGLATAATVIASQAVITGAYSLTRSAIQLGLLPRFEIRHTSEAHSGQIYIPRINMLLLVSVILLVLLFRSSTALASAYGISVTGTMVVTGMMGFVVIWKVWKWSPLAAACADRALPVSRPDLPRGQSPEGVRGRLGAAGARRRGDAADVHLAARQPAVVREVAQAGVSAGRAGGDAGKAAAAAGPRHSRVPDQRSPVRADCADAQSQALQGAAREECHSHHRDRADSADRSGRAGEDGTDQRDLLQGHTAVRIHGIAQCPESAGDRAQTGLAIRHHVDVVLPVAARAEAGRAFRNAALAGSPLHRAQPHRQRRHRLFPDPERAGGRGRNAGNHLGLPEPPKMPSSA